MRAIQIRQTYQQYIYQDTFTRDDLSTIQGNMFVSILEIKGLILPEEANRKNISKKPIDPVVEVRLETFQNRILREESSDPTGKAKRQLIFTSH